MNCRTLTSCLESWEKPAPPGAGTPAPAEGFSPLEGPCPSGRAQARALGRELSPRDARASSGYAAWGSRDAPRVPPGNPGQPGRCRQARRCSPSASTAVAAGAAANVARPPPSRPTAPPLSTQHTGRPLTSHPRQGAGKGSVRDTANQEPRVLSSAPG